MDIAISEQGQYVNDPSRDSAGPLSGVTACVVVGGDTLRAWEVKALRHAIDQGLVVTSVFAGVGPNRRHRGVRGGGYRVLQRRALRASPHHTVPPEAAVGPTVTVHRFCVSGPRLQPPPEVAAAITAEGADVVVSLGQDPLGGLERCAAPLGVVSFVHGGWSGDDPQALGFGEVLHAGRHITAAVRRDGGPADAARVVAASRHRVVSHSYTATVAALVDNASHLLAKGLVSVSRGVEPLPAMTAEADPVPSNAAVARLCVVLTRRTLARLIYGLTRTKQWRVGRTGPVDAAAVVGTVVLPTPDDVAVPPGYQFLADPLPGPDGSIWCEAMHRATGLGQIMALHPGLPPQAIEVPGTAGVHLAYPFVASVAGASYLIPEMSASRPSRAFRLDGTDLGQPQPLAGLDHERLVDPTLHRHDGRWWLFAGRPGSAGDLLWLWSAPDLLGPYEPHPDNPVVMDPSRARSAGPIIAIDGRLFRPGQNNTGGYGDGLTISEITGLTMTSYAEQPMGEIRLVDRHGPHTLVVGHDHAIVDSYTEAFDPLAWLHRLRNRASSRGA